MAKLTGRDGSRRVSRPPAGAGAYRTTSATWCTTPAETTNAGARVGDDVRASLVSARFTRHRPEAALRGTMAVRLCRHRRDGEERDVCPRRARGGFLA